VEDNGAKAMPEEPESKQSSQALELFKLFQQVGHSFLGLVILEIGWTFVLVLASKLTGEEHGPPAIGGLLLTHLWIYGGLVILLFWAAYSRLIAYVMRPFLLILKIVFDIIFVVVVLVFALIDLMLLPIVRPIRKWL
jgi:hypothetical protein